MKIIICYTNQDHNMILSIQSFETYLKKGKSVKDIENAIISSNKEAGWEKFRLLETTGDMEPVMRFCLGEDEYKRYYDISSLFEKLCEVENQLDDFGYDFSNLSYEMQSAREKIKELFNIEKE